MLNESLADRVYHGTSYSNAQKIMRTRKLRPRKGKASNWAWGNPSNPNWIYCTSSYAIASQYARDIGGDNSVVLEVIPDWGNVRIDEDVIADQMFDHRNKDSDLYHVFWNIYNDMVAEEMGYDEAEAEEMEPINENDPFWSEISDFELTDIMILISEQIPSAEARNIIEQNEMETFAFESVLDVIDII